MVTDTHICGFAWAEAMNDPGEIGKLADKEAGLDGPSRLFQNTQIASLHLSMGFSCTCLPTMNHCRPPCMPPYGQLTNFI